MTDRLYRMRHNDEADHWVVRVLRPEGVDDHGRATVRVEVDRRHTWARSPFDPIPDEVASVPIDYLTEFK